MTTAKILLTATTTTVGLIAIKPGTMAFSNHPVQTLAAMAQVDSMVAEIVATHNQYRSELNLSPLTWSESLAWGAEKQYFTAGTFPEVSSTGNWADVGHYTQLIWKETTQVGCAVATGGGLALLVCRYSPSGNFIGEPVY